MALSRASLDERSGKRNSTSGNAPVQAHSRERDIRFCVLTDIARFVERPLRVLGATSSLFTAEQRTLVRRIVWVA
jgi:hypothetical protein